MLGALFVLHYLTCMAIQFTGNPVRALFGERTPTESQMAALGKVFGLDDPCLKQQFNPCAGLFIDRLQAIFLHLDFGTNFRRQSVVGILADKFPYTLRLALFAFVIELVIGVAAGVLAGLHVGGLRDNMVKISSILMIAVPYVVIGFVVHTLLGNYVGSVLRAQGWLPDVISRGLFFPGYTSKYPNASLFLPAIALASVSIAVTARVTRISLIENLRADYVRAAKAKGLRPRRMVGVHILRNSLIPVVTFLGIDLASMLGGALVVENIFNIPGIGRAAYTSMLTGEVNVIIGATTMLVLIFLVVNLLVDLLYAVLDPRVRYQ
jgi:peptide/nickel transport system permease protein/oligopeptide transport system permease protein